MASVTPVQTPDLRSHSPSVQAPKSGDPFAMLLDHVAAKRASAPEPRRRSEAPDAPRVSGAERPERPQPKQEARSVAKDKAETPAAEEYVCPDEIKSTDGKVEAKDTDGSQPTDAAVNVDAEAATDEAVMLPVDAEVLPDASNSENAEEDSGETVVDGVDEDAQPAIATDDADLVVQAEVSVQQPVQQVIAPEAGPVAATAAAAEVAIDAAAVTPVAVAPVKNGTTETRPNAQSAVAADVETGPTGEETPQSAPQATKSEETSPLQKPVVSNHAEARDAAIAEKGEQAQTGNAGKPEVPAQAKEHASAKPLEHVPAQSSAENSVPRQQVTPQTTPVMPEPVRALAGSINPVNLRAAADGPNNAVQLNAQSIGVEIASRAKEGMRRFDIRLDPPELGRIDVRLEVDNSGKASTRLIVERPETLDLLQRDARNLERALQSAGLQTDEGGLEFSLRDQGQQGLADADSHGAHERRDHYLASVIEDAEPASPALERYARSVFARGGVDIRI